MLNRELIVSHSKNHHSKETAKTFYRGIDLHSKRSHVSIIDTDGKKVKEENLNNDPSLILQFLEPFGKDPHIAIESTMARTLGLYLITGAKVKTDRRDAFTNPTFFLKGPSRVFSPSDRYRPPVSRPSSEVLPAYKRHNHRRSQV